MLSQSGVTCVLRHNLPIDIQLRDQQAQVRRKVFVPPIVSLFPMPSSLISSISLCRVSTGLSSLNSKL